MSRVLVFCQTIICICISFSMFGQFSPIANFYYVVGLLINLSTLFAKNISHLFDLCNENCFAMKLMFEKDKASIWCG